ncbi:chitobiase/beta-hexosaminidase C-terminal domain-containing protein [bacterium]|nr:chitobiase/beta-hexosaminidase C-terminal domain-containing protein [bacterium]
MKKLLLIMIIMLTLLLAGCQWFHYPVSTTTTLLNNSPATTTSSSTTTSTTTTTTLPRAPAPIFSITGGEYESPVQISLSTVVSDATIRFTLDGTDPVGGNGIVYTNQLIRLSEPRNTINARTYKAGMSVSDLATNEYIITSAVYEPTFNVPSGFYESGQKIIFETLTVDAEINYSINNGASIKYSGPFDMPFGIPTRITAVASKNGVVSPTISNLYWTATEEGCIIFYDKGFYSDGWRYLETIPNDRIPCPHGWQITRIPWGGKGIYIGANNSSMGGGRLNTSIIVNTLGEGKYAAKLCYDLVYGGHDDWYLPNRNEVKALYHNLYEYGYSDLCKFGYWTSEEYNADKAYYNHFIKYYYTEDWERNEDKNSDYFGAWPVRQF